MVKSCKSCCFSVERETIFLLRVFSDAHFIACIVGFMIVSPEEREEGERKEKGNALLFK
jgi:hypothetical protein